MLSKQPICSVIQLTLQQTSRKIFNVKTEIKNRIEMKISLSKKLKVTRKERKTGKNTIVEKKKKHQNKDEVLSQYKEMISTYMVS